MKDPQNGNLPVAQRSGKLRLGQVIVELQQMRRKYSEMEKNREAFRSRVIAKPGEYEGYKVISVREVEVKAHFRRAHNRLLLPR